MVPVLSLMVLTVLGGAVLTFASGRLARWTALGTSVAFLVETAVVLAGYTVAPGTNGLGVPLVAYSESYRWLSIDWLHVNYTVGVDGISLILVLLTAFLQIATVIYSWEETRRPAAWFGLVLLTCLGCLGVFIAMDVLLFFLFWELVLVPMFFLIGFWGFSNRLYAALKFFV